MNAVSPRLSLMAGALILLAGCYSNNGGFLDLGQGSGGTGATGPDGGAAGAGGDAGNGGALLAHRAHFETSIARN